MKSASTNFEGLFKAYANRTRNAMKTQKIRIPNALELRN